MPLMTIEEAWESYRKTVIPEGAPPIQIDECRKAFYAGCATFVHYNYELGAPDISEETALQFLTDRTLECEEFVNSLQQPTESDKHDS